MDNTVRLIWGSEVVPNAGSALRRRSDRPASRCGPDWRRQLVDDGALGNRDPLSPRLRGLLRFWGEGAERRFGCVPEVAERWDIAGHSAALPDPGTLLTPRSVHRRY